MTDNTRKEQEIAMSISLTNEASQRVLSAKGYPWCSCGDVALMDWHDKNLNPVTIDGWVHSPLRECCRDEFDVRADERRKVISELVSWLEHPDLSARCYDPEDQLISTHEAIVALRELSAKNE